MEVKFSDSTKKNLRALIDSGASHTLAALGSKCFHKGTENNRKKVKKRKKNRVGLVVAIVRTILIMKLQ